MSATEQQPSVAEVLKHTPGPWAWVIEDHSMASLGVMPNPGIGDPLVLTVSPCRACQSRVTDGKWEWGRCQTPSLADATLIAAAPQLLAALMELRDNIGAASLSRNPYGREIRANADAAIAAALTPRPIGEGM